MKRLFLFTVLMSVIAAMNGHCQGHVISAPQIPASRANSISDISDYINSNYNTDRSRLEAAYAWVAANIRYDRDSMYSINSEKNPEARITEALRRRKGVCENYAAIFSAIAKGCGLKTEIITGYTKQYGRINYSGHSWVAVFLEGNWQLCDPTWDEGYRDKVDHFLVPPGVFILSHMPFDPIWQLQDRIVSHPYFEHGKLPEHINKHTYSFADSIAAYMRMSEYDRMHSVLHRMKENGPYNEIVQTRMAYIQMLVDITDEERDMKLYNTAVETFNRANVIFNAYIEFRNNQFTPQKQDHELRKLLDEIPTLLQIVREKTATLSQSNKNVQYDTGMLNSRIESMQTKLKEQQSFLSAYLATKEVERKKLF